MTIELPELVLTVTETATILKISESYTRRLIAKKTIPSVQVGRCRRVRSTDLSAYVAGLGGAQ